jgi:hypothetical protein
MHLFFRSWRGFSEAQSVPKLKEIADFGFLTEAGADLAKRNPCPN